jgi:trans-aconitate methyltransferase
LFEYHLESRLAGFSYSGFNLVKEVNALSPEKVIDVGCGVNFFKDKIQNLVGFDQDYHPNVDFVANVKDVDYPDNTVDVVLLLGPLQYLPKSDHYIQLRKIVKWVKPGGYIVYRIHPFVDYVGHNTDYEDSFWSINQRMEYKDFNEWTKILNLEVYKDIVLDKNINFPKVERLVWWWRKK